MLCFTQPATCCRCPSRPWRHIPASWGPRCCVPRPPAMQTGTCWPSPTPTGSAGPGGLSQAGTRCALASLDAAARGVRCWSSLGMDLTPNPPLSLQTPGWSQPPRLPVPPSSPQRFSRDLSQISRAMVYTHSVLPLPRGPGGRMVPSSPDSLLPTWSPAMFLPSVLPLLVKTLPHFSPALPALFFQPGLSSPVPSRAGGSQPAQPFPCCSRGCLSLLGAARFLQQHFSSSAAVGASPCDRPEPPHPLGDGAQTSLPVLPGHPSALSIPNAAETCWSCSPAASVSPPVRQYLPLQTRTAAGAEGDRQALDGFMAPRT